MRGRVPVLLAGLCLGLLAGCAHAPSAPPVPPAPAAGTPIAPDVLAQLGTMGQQMERRGRDNAEMAYIPAGTFTMGDGDGRSDEKPSHQVTVQAFWLDRTEVTNAQFARFVAAGNTAEGDWRAFPRRGENHPVWNVTWPDAVAYCGWADKRLPTEAEWEYAARGTDGRKYPWGNTWEDTRARVSDSRGWFEYTAPVGSHRSGASPFGVLDLAGNVWEWTSSLYKPYPYVATDGRESPNPSSTEFRVVRGGAWTDGSVMARATVRRWALPIGKHRTVFGLYLWNERIGFRCAQGIK